MAGGFVLVVGPSGAGKDTLIGLAREDLRADGRFVFPRRIVTRPASAHEDHDTLDAAAFEASREAGRFALWWRAHGLSYALPAATRAMALEGRVVVCNVSRAVIEAARSALPSVAVVEVTADPAILARRLGARGRAEDGDLRARLARTERLPPVAADLVIRNEGEPRAAADRLVAFLRERARPPAAARSAAPTA